MKEANTTKEYKEKEEKEERKEINIEME